MRVRSNWPGVLAVDAEVRLERQGHVHALGHVHERAAGPHRAVEGAELVVLGRHDRAEVLPEDVRVLLERLVGAHEHDAQLGQLLLDGVIHDLGVVLRPDARQELALGLGDAQPLERLLDLVRHVVPGLLLALGGLAVVDDLVEVDAVEPVGPRGHGPLEEVLVRAQPVLEHPLRLALDGRDLLDGLAGQTALRLVEVDQVVVERVLGAPVLDCLAGIGGHGSPGPRGRRAPASGPCDVGSIAG